MTIDSYCAVIESLPFQVQFSVLSGIQSVQRALSRDDTVKALMVELAAQPSMANVLFERIRFLAPRASVVTNLSYDESIVAYLYCLKKHDLTVARRASHLIWDAGGLLWSCWLAHEIIEFTREIEESIDFSSIATIDMFEIQEYGGQAFDASATSTAFLHTIVAREFSMAQVDLAMVG